uniref:Uncharacterized protein n=1 Tax=Meloidogyne enterolobii TaxID=390850 RepID=A0A6V7YCW9_MELEN|nr:unnamed protein product [Meloidogyne enterolobii]
MHSDRRYINGFGTQQQIPAQHQIWHHGIDTQPHTNYQYPQTFGI